MKKNMLILLLLGFSIFTSAAWGADTHESLTFGIVINVSAFPVELSGNTADVNWGTQAFGATVFSNLPQGHPRSTINQVGYATINLTVSATVAAATPYGGPSWTLTSTLPTGLNQVRLSGIFTAPLTTADASPMDPMYGHDLTTADFGPEDVITSLPTMASSTVFARPGELPIFRGYNISTSSGAISNLRYMIDLPPAGSTNTPQRIAVTVGGVPI